jgi:hypothetical protein
MAVAGGSVPGGWAIASGADWEHVGQPWIQQHEGGPESYTITEQYSEPAPGGGVNWVERYEPKSPYAAVSTRTGEAVGAYWRRVRIEQAATPSPPPGDEGGPPPGDEGGPPPGDEGGTPQPQAATLTVGGADPAWINERIAEARSLVPHGFPVPAGGFDVWRNDAYWTPYRVQNEINQYKTKRQQAGTDVALETVAQAAIEAERLAAAQGRTTTDTGQPQPPPSDGGPPTGGERPGGASDQGPPPTDGGITVPGTGLEQQKTDITAAQQKATQTYQEQIIAGQSEDRALEAAIAAGEQILRLGESIMELRRSPRDALLWSNVARGGGNAFYQTPARFISDILAGATPMESRIGGGRTGTQNAGVPALMGLPEPGQGQEIATGLPNWRIPTEFELTSGQVQGLSATERSALEGGMEMVGRSPQDVLRTAYNLTGRYGQTPFVTPTRV